MPSWIEHALWWHVYPLGAVGADTTGDAAPGPDDAPEHRLPQLEAWLDHVTDLGLNGLALGPVFASTTHGYDTVDHFAVDPRLGDADDLRHLVAAAHDRGVRVLLDGVFNHVGREHPFVRAALADPGSPEARLLARDADGGVVPFEGHALLVTLDHSSPDVEDLVVEVMTHWLDQGVDGWRLDAAYAVPTSFWARVLPRVRERHPEAYVVAEVLHGDHAAFVAESGVDSVTQYELWKAVWSSLDQRNLYELDWALQRHASFVDAFAPWTFVGNHDVTRIASQVDDERHLPHAVVLLATLPGTPAVYAGDEFELRAVKEERVGGDDAVRPALPGTPGDAVSDGGFLGATTPDRARAMLALHQELLGLRRRHPWLHRAVVQRLSLTNETLAYEVRERDGGGRLVVALDLDDAELVVEDAVSGPGAGGAGAGGAASPVGLLAGSASRRDASWVVPPHGWAVLG